MLSAKHSVFNAFGVCSSKTAEMVVKQLIYDSCMIVEKGTIISIQYDIQCSHKKHDGMMENL